ncbi:MAG: hypothetical protein KKG25_12605 [Bacteroidetes bacterium]|nr:hypothetical protein [Bacteroidota bacterium]MBU1485681.1 hypothetical protein [Bacteroidota bacterium]MBU2268934.1 hypothetical protein [Bacteroidota bacterium]MBU2375765.1 hypothetical protein [Bacteroidota bacterium]
MINKIDEVDSNRELQDLIEIIERGSISFLGFVSALNSGRKIQNEVVAMGLVMNYSFDFTEKLINILQLLDIPFKSFIKSFIYDEVPWTIIEGQSVISELMKDRKDSVKRLVQAKKYTSISGNNLDSYLNKLDFYSKLVEKNLQQINFC